MRHRFAHTMGRLLPALSFLLAGCASIPDAVRDPGADATSVELADTPFFPQERYQCGPAALTTALFASGADVSLDGIVRKVYLPGRSGSLQADMIGATRTSGRVPYVVDGTISALYGELEAGRPIVVLQNLGVTAIPRWHYAVFIGLDPENGHVVLRSGTDHRRVTPIDVFLRTWRRSDYWGLVVLRPDELPADADRVRYFEAIAALEQTGQAATALAAWKAALGEWPGNATAMFGLANAFHANGDLGDAERAYRALLMKQPDMLAARNNLAMTLAELGRFEEALREIDEALTATTDPALEPELMDTRRTVLRLMHDGTPQGARPGGRFEVKPVAVREPLLRL